MALLRNYINGQTALVNSLKQTKGAGRQAAAAGRGGGPAPAAAAQPAASQQLTTIQEEMQGLLQVRAARLQPRG